MYVYLIQWEKMKMLKYKITSLIMTAGQFLILPSIYFILTNTHTYSMILISILCCYLFTGIGFSLSAHRYFSHRQFKVSKFKEKILSILTVLGTWSSPIEWVAQHKHHHQNSDTENDVHSTKYIGWYNSFYFFHKTHLIKPGNYTVGRLMSDTWHKFLLTYKHVIILFYASLTYYLGGIDLLYYMFVIPTAYSLWAQMISVLNHVDGKPHDSFWQNIFTFGEGYHDYHHKHPKDYTKGLFLKPVINMIKDKNA
mgnify:CR=1 FL=1